jgi:hypothetical protein
MMELSVVEEDGVRVVEGQPDQPFLSNVEDANRIIEACFAEDVESVLLYPHNLTAAFFDLSSGEAGAILQKLRNYGIRLAIVRPPGSLPFSSRFGDLLVEERQGSYFQVFETRSEAWAWLGAANSP